MAKHNNIDAAMDDIKETLNENLEKGNGNISVKMAVKYDKMQFANPFVIFFCASLLKIIEEYNLTRLEIKVLLRMMDVMKYGNAINVSFTQILRDIGSDPSNSSKVMKRLKDAKLIIEEGGHTFLNPHVVAKGNINENNPDDAALLEHAAAELEEIGIGPGITTKAMRKKRKAKEAA